MALPIVEKRCQLLELGERFNEWRNAHMVDAVELNIFSTALLLEGDAFTDFIDLLDSSKTTRLSYLKRAISHYNTADSVLKHLTRYWLKECSQKAYARHHFPNGPSSSCVSDVLNALDALGKECTLDPSDKYELPLKKKTEAFTISAYLADIEDIFGGEENEAQMQQHSEEQSSDSVFGQSIGPIAGATFNASINFCNNPALRVFYLNTVSCSCAAEFCEETCALLKGFRAVHDFFTGTNKERCERLRCLDFLQVEPYFMDFCAIACTYMFSWCPENLERQQQMDKVLKLSSQLPIESTPVFNSKENAFIQTTAISELRTFYASGLTARQQWTAWFLLNKMYMKFFNCDRRGYDNADMAWLVQPESFEPDFGPARNLPQNNVHLIPRGYNSLIYGIRIPKTGIVVSIRGFHLCEFEAGRRASAMKLLEYGDEAISRLREKIRKRLLIANRRIRRNGAGRLIKHPKPSLRDLRTANRLANSVDQSLARFSYDLFNEAQNLSPRILYHEYAQNFNFTVSPNGQLFLAHPVYDRLLNLDVLIYNKDGSVEFVEVDKSHSEKVNKLGFRGVISAECNTAERVFLSSNVENIDTITILLKTIFIKNSVEYVTHEANLARCVENSTGRKCGADGQRGYLTRCDPTLANFFIKSNQTLKSMHFSTPTKNVYLKNDNR